MDRALDLAVSLRPVPASTSAPTPTHRPAPAARFLARFAGICAGLVTALPTLAICPPSDAAAQLIAHPLPHPRPPRPPHADPRPDPKPDPAPHADRPVIQIALLLDTSNSMDGLIAQAKTELWSIVNTLAMAKRRGERADIRVALYEYGNDSLSSGEGFVRMVTPFTSDLDRVSEKLFALRTNGGSEFCGKVIDDAVGQLAWTAGTEDLRLIVVAGNEPFTQGETDYRASVPRATRRGIVVNTVFCGGRDEGDQSGWSDGARLGGGTYASINSNRTMKYIRCPQDDRISRLGDELNQTYIAYGADGEAAAVNQQRQDANAAGALPHAGASVARAITKSSAAYRNGHWDLVDAVKEERISLRDMKREELPPALQNLSAKELDDYVAGRAAERARLQAEIATLQRERDEFLRQQQAEAGTAAETLGAVLAASLKEQAAKLGYDFER